MRSAELAPAAAGHCGGGSDGSAERRHPERYSRRQLRTLQRRVSQWRGVMAKRLVYASAEGRGANSEV